MNYHVSIFVIVLLIPALVGASWFVGYVFVEEHHTYFVLAAAVVIAYSTLLFGISLRHSRLEYTLTEKASAGKNHFYEDLYTNSPLPYLIITDKGDVLSGNSAAARLFETTLVNIKYINVFEALKNDENKDIEIFFSKVSAGISIKDVELLLLTSTRTQRWVSISLHTNQATNQRLLSLVDITEKKKIDIAKSEFASLVTHQLRTPVAAMRWNVELLAQTLPVPLSANQQKYLDKVQRNILRMLDLITDFLSVSKLETGTFETSPETINLSEYFDGIIDEYSGTILEKRLRIDRRYATPDAKITIDTRLFHIITSNLLSNAVKYTPEDGAVVFGYELLGKQCRVVVADTGIGIPEADIQRLFSKFFRATNAVKHRTEGTGLGLYIVKQSVEKLGGTIKVFSKEQQGTTFDITIPLAS